MKVAILKKPSQFKIQQVDIPSIVKDYIPLDVSACGICGSDLAIFPKDPPIPLYWPGHEISGYLDDQLFVVNPLIECGKCTFCLNGNENLCKNVRMVSHHLPGGFANVVYVPESNLKAIESSPNVSSMVEPIAASLHAINQAKLNVDDKVLIIGGGVIGMIILQLLIKKGIKNISLLAKYDYQNKVAKQFGSKKFSFTPDKIIIAVGGDGSALQKAVDTIKPQGRIVMMGNIYLSRPLNLKWLVENEIIVSGSQRYLNKEFDKAITIVEKGEIVLESLITHKFSLDEIQKAFAVALNKEKNNAIKVLITSFL